MDLTTDAITLAGQDENDVNENNGRYVACKMDTYSQ